MKGNEAIAYAAINCGCDGYFATPSPQSEVMETLMQENLGDYRDGGTQAESETSSINMVYGGACCGKGYDSSSSPGISLMRRPQLPGRLRTSCLVVNVMRGGPGLGTIQPSQSDYFQATKVAVMVTTGPLSSPLLPYRICTTLWIYHLNSHLNTEIP